MNYILLVIILEFLPFSIYFLVCIFYLKNSTLEHFKLLTIKYIKYTYLYMVLVTIAMALYLLYIHLYIISDLSLLTKLEIYIVYSIYIIVNIILILKIRNHIRKI